MGKTYKIIVCGKKMTGKTTILEQLIYNNSINSSANASGQRLNSSTSSSAIAAIQQQQQSGSGAGGGVNVNDKYFATLEDTYVACWEKDKGIKEKFRFYDTRGLDNSKDGDTINMMRHLFPLVDGAVLIFSSYDSDSAQCVEKLKTEIEKSKDKKEICHFIIIDNACPTPVTTAASAVENLTSSNRELIRMDLQNRLKASAYEISSLEKRELLAKPFVDLFTNMTQLPTKGSMNIVQSIKKPKVFSK